MEGDCNGSSLEFDETVGVQGIRNQRVESQWKKTLQVAPANPEKLSN